MSTPEYDTREGIASFLVDLESINRLKKLRHEAGYDRNERMGEWVVMGRWRLSTNGNFDTIVARYDGKIPAEMGNCPLVMTEDEAYVFIGGGSITSTSGWSFPPHYAKCRSCGVAWTIANCHDVKTSQDSDEGETSLEAFVGQPLAKIEAIPAFVNKQVHFIDRDAVYNANLPDPKEDGKYDRENTRLSLHKKKWHYVPKDHIIQTGDHAMIQFVHFEHTDCYRSRLNRLTLDHFKEAFAKAGYPDVRLITQPNQYCPCDECPPWYFAQVQNEVPLTVGWRKRVINIDWSASGRKLPDLFEGEGVTKGDTHIHAHGYEKLAEYLAKLMPELLKP